MSQTTEIPFIGVHNTTTENLNENGEVAMSFGLTSNDVAATTTMPAVTHLYHIDGCRILLIHDGSGFKNVFVARPSYDDNGEVTAWVTEAYTYDALTNPEASPAIMCSEPGLPNSTAVLGNVVVLNYDDKCRYAFRQNGTYKLRDNYIPPLKLKYTCWCRLLRRLPTGGIGYVDGDNSNYPDGFRPTSISVISDAVPSIKNIKEVGQPNNRYDELENEKEWMGWFSELRSFYSKDHGYLFDPVLVRACYRLKTGNVACVTNPVLCFPFDGSKIGAFYCKHQTDVGTSTDWYVFGIGYKIFVEIESCASDDFAEIIDSIEIYISKPLNTMSNDGRDIRIQTVDTNEATATVSDFLIGTEYDSHYFEKILLCGADKKLDLECLYELDTFYLAKRIEFSNKYASDAVNKKENYSTLAMKRRRLLTDDGGNNMDATTDSIVTRPQLEDPLRSNIKHYANDVYVSNNRIIECGRNYDYSSFHISDCTYNDEITYKDENTFIFKDIKRAEKHSLYFCCFNIKNDYIDNYISGNAVCCEIGKFYTVEEPNITRCRGYKIDFDNYEYSVCEIEFCRHPYINASCCTGRVISEYKAGTFYSFQDLENDWGLKIWNNKYIDRKNDYIRLSNVGDPYSFDASNTAYFNSPVERVMIVPEAITLGQYGTDQIYVICQDGVYTVGLNDEGKLTRVNTFTSDKIDANRACIAGGQLFVNNGISWDFYQGQNRNQFLSMKRNTAFHFDNLPHILSLNETKQWEWCLQGDNLFDFMQRCTLYYDSINAQIIGVVPNTGFYLVWSKDDGFRMVKSNAEYRVQYNTLLLADNNSNLYDFEATDTVQQDDGMVIMRPFHLNAEQKNGLSTVRSIIVRGNFDSSTSNCAVKIILYGTMDYKTWHVVASSTRYYITGISGTPYAAFRLVILARLKRDEYLSHITVEYDNKESKRLHF